MQKTERSEISVVEYIESMLGQLHAMAASQNSPTLAYLIEMARIEAHDQVAHHMSRGSDRRNKTAGMAL